MTPVSTASLNVADRLAEMAAIVPDLVAVAEPTRRITDGRRVYRTVTFRQLADDIERIARGLATIGVTRGMRLALLVPPSIDFIALVFGLLKSGAVQILIDPGMGKRNLVRCLAEAEPEGFVAVPRAQLLRAVLSRRFPKAQCNVTVGRRALLRGTTLVDLRRLGELQRNTFSTPVRGMPHSAPRPERDRGRSLQTTTNDPAAIIFTSGSTGPPKGVLYRHGNFHRQVTEIRDKYKIEPGEIDLACFALFGLFNAAMGVTTVLPRMNFSRPAAVNPRKIVEAIDQWQVTQSFASPAVWRRVGPYCQARGLRLQSLRCVMSAGAPVQANVLQSMRAVIAGDGELHTPYGATEALPVATITASEVLSQTWPKTEQGAGICVGPPFPGIDCRIIRIVDGPIRTIDEAEELANGEVGELIVRGRVVTSEYVTRREANELTKIADIASAHPDTDDSPTSSFWHRMGDCGYLDDSGRFWFCGRVNQRVVTEAVTLFTISVEAQFNMLTGVVRSALVGIGPRDRQQPAIVLESVRRFSNSPTQKRRLPFEPDRAVDIMRRTGVRHLIVYPRTLPVDVRHNAKIVREQLAVWAERQLLRRRQPRCVLLRDVV